MPNNILKILLFITLFVGVVTLTNAQTEVSGQVRDTLGFPLPGVSIVVEGTTTGVSTDFDGFYTINYEFDENTVLVFSYIGFKTKKINVDGQSEINILMKEDISALKEVVIIGYGSQLKKDVTGSVSTIDGESFESRPNTQVGSLLQGQSAGVQVQSNSGDPSGGFSVRIRGTSSILAGSEPLYVVDGVPTNDTRSINPSDIDTITVLKDASSAAIYGAQGANGVVIITTKRGTSSKPKISLDIYSGFSKVWKTLPVLNGEQYRDLMAELGIGLATDWNSLTAKTDWQDEVFRSGFSQNYQASISGKSESTNYFISGGYLAQEGAVRSSELQRANFKINIDQKINDWLKIGSRIAFSAYRDVEINDNNNVNQGGVLLGALTTPSVIGIFNDDGTFTSNPFQNWENPLASTDGLEREYNEQRLLGNLYLEAKFAKDFKYRFNYGSDNNHGIFDSFLDPFRTTNGVALEGQSKNNTNKRTYYIIDNTISYKKTFGKHNVEGLVGVVLQKFRFEDSQIDVRGFASGVVTTPNAGAEPFAFTAFKSETSNTSLLSRVNYNYEDKYLFTGNFRVDGSSVFGPDNRYGYFPSLSFGWRVSNENFFKEDSFINDLKLRVGWGIVGNASIPAYSYLGLVGFGANYPIAGQNQSGSFQRSIENFELKWETSEQINIGIDFSLFDSRVNLTADAYLKNTRDLLFDRRLPTTTGFASVRQNVGQVQNKGVELAINTAIIQSDNLTWNTGFNISANRNKVIDINGDELLTGGIPGRGETNLVREGKSLGSLYGYVFGGVDPTTGNSFYIDREGRSTFNPNPEEDRTIIGNANPDFIYGLTNTLSYKNFSLFVFLQGSQGNDLLNATRIETEGMLDPKNQSIVVLNRWRQPGDITDIPRASAGNVNNSRISTRFIEDASYLRFKTLTLSYSFPKKVLDQLNISGLKMYTTGENIFTITDYSGFDPEVNAFGGNAAGGVDFGTYPQTKNLIFGMNIEF